MEQVLLTLLLLSIVALFAWRVIEKQIIRPRRRRSTLRPAEHCRCGYPLTGLDVPRCPECGRVAGTDRTPQELGLSHQQLQQFIYRRIQRASRTHVAPVPVIKRTKLQRKDEALEGFVD